MLLCVVFFRRVLGAQGGLNNRLNVSAHFFLYLLSLLSSLSLRQTRVQTCPQTVLLKNQSSNLLPSIGYY